MSMQAEKVAGDDEIAMNITSDVGVAASTSCLILPLLLHALVLDWIKLFLRTNVFLSFQPVCVWLHTVCRIRQNIGHPILGPALFEGPRFI